MRADVNLLKISFRQAASQGDSFVDDFYRNFFALAPDVEPLFEEDMGDLRQKLLNSLRTIIDSIENELFIRSYLGYLGGQHKHLYHVEGKYYPAFGQAIVETLKQYLQEKWTPAYEKAWIEAIQYVSNLMQT